jgi:hypothetical protein
MRSLAKLSVLAAAAAVLAAPSAGATPRPHGLQLLFNGKHVPLVPILGGSDNYAVIHQHTMFVQVKWTGEARGSGYFVRIATDEPQEKVWASCFRGTSCQIPLPIPLPLDVETSWYVEVVTAASHKVVVGYKYCLVRYT